VNYKEIRKKAKERRDVKKDINFLKKRVMKYSRMNHTAFGVIHDLQEELNRVKNQRDADCRQANVTIAKLWKEVGALKDDRGH